MSGVTQNIVPAPDRQAESPALPTATSHVDADVDVEVLRAIPKAFAIEDERSASWLVRRVLAAREYGRRVREWSEQERRRAEREEQTLMYLFGRQIEAWATNEIAKLGGRRKSINLPGGMVGFRKKNASLVIHNEQAVLAWAKKNVPDAVETVEKLRKTAINDHFSETGELPDGVHVESAVERFYVG